MRLLLDVAVLLADARPDHESHRTAHRVVSHSLLHAESVIVPDAVLLAVVRLATRSRAFVSPSSSEAAIAYVQTLRRHPAFVPVVSTPSTFDRQLRLLAHAGSSANEIADTYLAALAIEHSATLVSFDRGFSRFPGLAWIDPADPAGLAMLTG